MARLNTKAVALAGAIVVGAAMFLLPWWVMAFEGNTGAPAPFAMVYRGYAISPAGSFVGLFWGLIEGAIAGAAFSALYNSFAGFRTPRRLERTREREATRPYHEIER